MGIWVMKWLVELSCFSTTGNVDPVKCSILEGGSILEVQQGIYTPLTVEARDKFGNICPLSEQDVHSYSVEVTKVGQIIINLANYSFYYLCFPRILETSFF